MSIIKPITGALIATSLATDFVFIPAASGDGSLSDIIASACCDLDATKTLSYDNSTDLQKWKNLVTAPADGAGQTDYDFHRGLDGSSSTDDPTFTGSAGSAAAFWAMDGGDLFRLVAATNPTLFKNMHKTTGSSDFTIILVWQTPAVDASTEILFSTQSTSGNVIGFRFQQSSSELIIARQRGDSTNSTLTGSEVLTGATPYVTGVGHKHSTNVSKIWLNESAGAESAQTFDTTTTDPTSPATIGASGTSLPVPAGTRIYAFSAYNEYLSDEQMALVLAEYETRHERDYTP